MHGANRTGRPFTGDVSGTLLFSTLHELGLSSSALATSANDGMRLIDCRITNAVRCVPPGNKPSAAEVNRCSGFLAYDLDRLYRDGRRQAAVAVLALGHVAHDAVLNVLDERQVDWPFGHGALHEPRPGLALVDSYHPSRQNTNTGRLTTAMFRDAVARAVEFIG
jgi:uracil-DNA glycosylase family 4